MHRFNLFASVLALFGSVSILTGCMQTMGIDPRKIDLVLLSHAHGDHTNGLEAFSGQNTAAAVYMPRSFREAYGEDFVETGCGAVIEL